MSTDDPDAARDPVPVDGPSRGQSVDQTGPWRWQGADDAGIALGEPSLRFASQESAERWLEEHFEDLADDGVATVTLFDGERAVYGPMPLDPG